MWRLWGFASGAPLGALAALALLPSPSLAVFEAALAFAALGVGGLAWVLARFGADEPERGRHTAHAASLAWLALPAAAVIWLGLAPSGPWLLGAVLVVLGAAALRAIRVRGPAQSVVRHAALLAGVLVLEVVLLLTLAGAIAVLGGPRPAPAEHFGPAAWDIDAGVPLGPVPACEDRVARVEMLLERGAHPALADDGAVDFFDAPGADGRRQVQRLDRRTHEVRCWTCDEPGNNRRPALAPAGRALVFDTDRHATWRTPADTELHWMGAGGAEPPPVHSRRLTFAPGPDDHPRFDPTGRGVLWTRGEGGRFLVVRAAIETGHGGLLLGPTVPVARGGVGWIAPLAWSSDARQLVSGRGIGIGPLRAVALDPAAEKRRVVTDRAAGSGAVSFSSDGSRMLVATARDVGPASLLPGGSGFLVGRLAPWLPVGEVDASAGTGVQVSDDRGALRELQLGELASWGAPTGVALFPDGRSFVLGQRRPAPDGEGERLVRVELACAAPAS